MSVFIYTVEDLEGREALRTEFALGPEGLRAARELARLIGGRVIEHRFEFADSEIVETYPEPEEA